MSTIGQITDSLIIARHLYSDLNAERITDLKRGCGDCVPKNYTCLGRLVQALEWEVSKGVVTSITEKLYYDLLLIIRGGIIKFPPTVNAGPDQSAQGSQTVNFNAVATQGSAPILSYLWEKVSGQTVLMTGATTSRLTVSGLTGDMPVGNYVFKITVTDSNGLTGSDTVGLIVTAVVLISYYGSAPTNAILNLSQIQGGAQSAFNQGDDVRIPWNVSDLSYLWFAIPIDESIKNYFTDLSNPLNQSVIGTDEDLFGSPTVVGGYNFYITNYLSSYSVSNVAIRGLVFTRLLDSNDFGGLPLPSPVD